MNKPNATSFSIETLLSHLIDAECNSYNTLLSIKDLILQHQTLEIYNSHPNPLNKYGKKCFSQSDEDGITLEILRRLSLSKGCYAELGVGDGLENNTLILAALGWQGFWIGNEELAFSYKNSDRFTYIRDWVNLENIINHFKVQFNEFGIENLDVLSVDLDGNDIYFVEKLLENNISPKLFIVEYNAKFPPPVMFQIDYNQNHAWNGDDYFGASIASYVELFKKYGYKIVCCNSHAGTNAFFVKSDFQTLFDDVPNDINDIYVAPRYHMYHSFGHKCSKAVVELILNRPC